MGKRGKKEIKPQEHAPLPSHSAPAKHPLLLAVSVVLFVLWFVFLLVTALAR